MDTTSLEIKKPPPGEPILEEVPEPETRVARQRRSGVRRLVQTVVPIVGLLAETRDCRCRNDNRTVCDEPFEIDTDDCPVAACIGGGFASEPCTDDGDCLAGSDRGLCALSRS